MSKRHQDIKVLKCGFLSLKHFRFLKIQDFIKKLTVMSVMCIGSNSETIFKCFFFKIFITKREQF